jgi:hypothetical protein
MRLKYGNEYITVISRARRINTGSGRVIQKFLEVVAIEQKRFLILYVVSNAATLTWPNCHGRPLLPVTAEDTGRGLPAFLRQPFFREPNCTWANGYVNQ